MEIGPEEQKYDDRTLELFSDLPKFRINDTVVSGKLVAYHMKQQNISKLAIVQAIMLALVTSNQVPINMLLPWIILEEKQYCWPLASTCTVELQGKNKTKQ